MSGKFNWCWADYEREKRKWERRKRDFERTRPVAAKLRAEAEAAGRARAQKSDAGEGVETTGHTFPDRGGALALTGARPAPIEIPKGASVDAARQQRDGIGRRQEGSSPRTRPTRPSRNASPFPPKAFKRGALIDLSAVPSAMELAQDERNAGVQLIQDARPRRQCGPGEALCRCGGKGNVPGPVPAWFGEKCIENDCPLRRKTREVTA